MHASEPPAVAMKMALVYIQALVMYGGLLLLGQGAVYLMSMGRHEDNVVFRLFRFVTAPIVKGTRLITPRQVADRHVPVVAFLLLFWIFFALALYIPRLP